MVVMSRSATHSRRRRAGRPKAPPGTRAATLSVSLSPRLAARTREVAAQEHRKNSGIVAAALELYTALPHDVRHILDTLNESLRPDERAQLYRAIRGIAAARELAALSAEAVANLRAQGREVEQLSEEALVERANEAVRATRARRPAGRRRRSA